jgi:hypothetical protein
VAGDTMNYWIKDHRAALLEVLKGLDVLLINDTETRMLAGNNNLVQAARAVHGHGAAHAGRQARRVRRDAFSTSSFSQRRIAQQHLQGARAAAGRSGGPHRRGRQLCRRILRLPGFAARAHAGAFRRAMFYGSVMGSFAVERFGTERIAAALPQGDRRPLHRLPRVDSP